MKFSGDQQALTAPEWSNKKVFALVSGDCVPTSLIWELSVGALAISFLSVISVTNHHQHL